MATLSGPLAVYFRKGDAFETLLKMFFSDHSSVGFLLKSLEFLETKVSSGVQPRGLRIQRHAMALRKLQSWSPEATIRDRLAEYTETFSRKRVEKIC